LATVLWNSPGGGIWENPANWSTGSLPGPADDVVLDVNALDPGATLTHSSDATSIHSLTSNLTNAASIAFSGGSLTLGGASTLDNDTTLNFSGGTIGGSGDLTLNGPLNWTGGTMGGAGTTNAGGGLTIGGSASKALDARTLNITANTSATWTGSGDIAVGNGAVLDNQVNATFTVQTQGNQGISTFGVRGTFRNEGTFTKSASTGTTTIGTRFDNSGTVAVDTGTLALTLGGTSGGGFTVAQGAALQFGGGVHRLTPASGIGGAGTVEFAGGMTEVAGAYGVTGGTLVTGGDVGFGGAIASVGGALTISQGTADFGTNNVSTTTATFGGGTLLGVGDVLVTGALTWTGTVMGGFGSTTVGDGANGATLTITGAAGKTLDFRTLNVSSNATATWRGTGNIALLDGAAINNQAGATFNVQIDQQVLFAGGAVAAFNNAGTLVQDLSTGTTTIGTRFNNSGTVAVNTGTLALTLGGASGGGFTVAQGATLRFGGGVHRLSGAVGGAGAVEFSAGSTGVAGTYGVTGGTLVSGGDVSFGGAVAGVGAALTISQGTADFGTNDVRVATATFGGGTLLGVGDVLVTGALTWTGTLMGGYGSTTVGDGTASATLTITGPGGKTLDARTLTISSNATANWTASTAGITLGDGAVINNAGTFNVQTNQPVSGFGATGAFNNTGTFRKSNSTDVTNVGVPFNNDGQVLVDTGTLTLSLGGTSNGSFTVSGGSTSPTLIFGGGTHRLSAASGISGAGAVVFSGGDTAVAGAYGITGSTRVTSLSASVSFLNATGPATSGAFSNAGGTVTIGTGGTLTVSGDYTQTSGTTNLNGAALAATNVRIQGGILLASGAISATVTNGGELDLGGPLTPGALTINGDYVQTATGTLNIKVGGDTAGAQYDQLVVNGNATLDGGLNARLIDNFSPPTNDTFQILVCLGGTVSGTFSRRSLGPRFVDPPTYDPSDVTLVAN
jgi:hypothetical protein